MKFTLAPAIAELENARHVVKTNEPINRREGNKTQADLERKHARSFTEAIRVLAESGKEKNA
jgi:hypothetical protein